MTMYLGSNKVAGNNLNTNKTRLFYNPDGITGNIPLELSSSLFRKLLIVYASNANMYCSAEIPVSKVAFSLSIVDDNGGGTNAWMKTTDYVIQDKQIAVTAHLWRNINSNEASTADNCIKVIEVIGITDDEIFIPKLNSPTHHTDKNGWVVFDHGTYKEYIKYVTFTVSVGASAWGNMNISNLPEGISLLGNRFLSGTCACRDAAIDLDIISYPDWASINVTYRNNYGAALSQPGQAYLRILEIPELL